MIGKAMVEHYGWTPETYHATPEGGDSEFKQRGLDFDTFVHRTQQQNEEGLPVMLEVPILTWKSHKPWDLLMIVTKPMPGFAHRSNWAKMATLAHEGFRYHISLCFVNELPTDGDEGWNAYQRIREKYDGKKGVLKISVWNAEARLQPGHNEFTDAILHDRDIAFLHDAGRYRDRSLHVST